MTIEDVGYTYVDNDEILKTVITRLASISPEYVVLDIETNGLDPYLYDILLIQIYIPETKELYILNCRTTSPHLQNKFIRVLWREGQGCLMGYNLKFDLNFLLVNYPEYYFENVLDVFIIEQLLLNGVVMKPPSLGETVLKYLGVVMEKETRNEFIDYKGYTFTKKQLDYGARDVSVLPRIYEMQQKFVEGRDLGFISNIECKTVPALSKLEVDGIYIDPDRWKKNEFYARDNRKATIEKMNIAALKHYEADLFGYPKINWDSPKQVLDFLRIEVDKKIEDTNEKTLELINHPFIKLLLEFREHSKLISSYGDSVLGLINPKTHRIHPSYHQLRAKTGRLASSNPNIMQVPKAKVIDEFGKKHSIYREAFVPQLSTGKMVGADYSSFELRILTDLTQEPEWIKGYTKNLDMHSVVASFIFGKKVSKKENPELREIGKAINFGIAYGMGPKKLSESMSVILKRVVSIQEASDVLKKFFKAFPKIKEWQEIYVSQMLSQKYMRNPYDGRILNIEGKDWSSMKIISAVSNEAKNFPCQSTNATVLKIALVTLQKFLANNKARARIVAPVHDEILMECDDASEAEIMAPLLKKHMEQAAEFFIKSVPVIAETYVADYWLKE